MLDTDQLRSFLAIVDCGSFTKAAERVHKTQSAVSMHIRRLEEQLGCALFVKHGRGARLTAEGERLIEFARRIIQVEAGALAAAVAQGAQGRGQARNAGRLRRVVPGRDPRAFQSPPPFCRGLRRLRGLARASRAGRRRSARAGAGDRPSGFHGLELLREEPLVWAAAERFRIEDGAPVPACARQRDLRLASGGGRRLAAAPRPTRGLFFSKNFTAIGTVVRAGLAATILPVSMVGQGLRRLGPKRGTARIAGEPHGPDPCARTPDRGSQGARRGDPRDHRRARAPGRLTGRARRIFSRRRPWFTFSNDGALGLRRR